MGRIDRSAWNWAGSFRSCSTEARRNTDWFDDFFVFVLVVSVLEDACRLELREPLSPLVTILYGDVLRLATGVDFGAAAADGTRLVGMRRTSEGDAVGLGGSGSS